MTTAEISLNDCKSNAYSQFGEDGVLSRLFAEIGVKHEYFCEFGAWDGMYLSNSYNLCQSGWRGCYIEGDKAKFTQLLRNIGNKATCVCTYVVSTEALPGTSDTLDDILTRVGA